MEIVLKSVFDKKALDDARSEIRKRQDEIEMLRKVCDHYRKICPRTKGYSYDDRGGVTCWACETCGYDH